MDCILNVYKPAGPTSHDVVARVRKITGQRRVGHAGTLDPAADGVLVICVGRATRFVEHLTGHAKRYRATIVFGVSTDTYDLDGQIVGRGAVTFDESQLRAALGSWVGRVEQTVPPHSAVQQGGQRLYRLARAGAAIELPSRQIEIYGLDRLDWTPPAAVVDVHCSKGTYVRSLAHDLGQQLGSGAYLHQLTRVASGAFHLDEAKTLEELAAAWAQGNATAVAYAPDEALLDLPAVVLSASDAQRLRQGQPWLRPPLASDTLRAYGPGGHFLGLLEWQVEPAKPTGGYWQPARVIDPQS